MFGFIALMLFASFVYNIFSGSILLALFALAGAMFFFIIHLSEMKVRNRGSHWSDGSF